MGNNEPNYKVLSTATIKGNNVQLREYATHWGVFITYEHGNCIEHVKDNYLSAERKYHTLIVTQKC